MTVTCRKEIIVLERIVLGCFVCVCVCVCVCVDWIAID